MRDKTILVLAVLFLCACPAFAVVEFNDGLIHSINHNVNDSIRVDYQTPSMYTTIDVLDYADIDHPIRR